MLIFFTEAPSLTGGVLLYRHTAGRGNAAASLCIGYVCSCERVAGARWAPVRSGRLLPTVGRRPPPSPPALFLLGSLVVSWTDEN